MLFRDIHPSEFARQLRQGELPQLSLPKLELTKLFTLDELLPFKRNKTYEAPRSTSLQLPVVTSEIDQVRQFLQQLYTSSIQQIEQASAPKIEINIQPKLMIAAVPTDGRDEEEEKCQPDVAQVQMIDTGEATGLAEDDDEYVVKRCQKTHDCSHRCNGVADEVECLPCLADGCRDEASRLPSVDELCSICYTAELGGQSCVQLGCGHVFHADCVLQLLSHKWNTLRITFAFLSCPSCKQDITADKCVPVKVELDKHLQLKSKIQTEALEVAKNQGLDKDERLSTEGDFYFGKLLALAMHSCSFYQCFECEKPYFGGMIDCQAELGVEEKATKEDLKCKACVAKAYGAGLDTCEKHGTDEIDWKCMFCCSVALWHCFGTTYFCNRCHDEYCQPPYNQVKVRDCHGVDCALGVPHPVGGPDYHKTAFPLGCGLCRSEKLHSLQDNAHLIQEISLKPVEYQRPNPGANPNLNRRARPQMRRRMVRRVEPVQHLPQRAPLNRRINRQAVIVEPAAVQRPAREGHVNIAERRAQVAQQQANAKREQMEKAKERREQLMKERLERFGDQEKMDAAQDAALKKKEEQILKVRNQAIERKNKAAEQKQEKLRQIQEQRELKEAAVKAKMERIDQLMATPKKSVHADKMAKLKELSERTKLIRQSLKLRPQTAKAAADKPDSRAFNF